MSHLYRTTLEQRVQKAEAFFEPRVMKAARTKRRQFRVPRRVMNLYAPYPLDGPTVRRSIQSILNRHTIPLRAVVATKDGDRTIVTLVSQ